MGIRPFIYSFLKFQIAAIIATGIDLSVFFVLQNQIWYVTATAIGALCGAISNFIICRYWAANAAGSKLAKQAFKYIIVSAGSLILNALIVYLLTEFISIPKEFSRIIAAISVAIFYNFLLQKYFVFRT